MSAVYAVYTSPTHPPIPNHLPTLIVTPHGQPSNILYSYLHTNFNAENYLLTPSPQGDLCVAKLFPPRRTGPGGSDSGHSSGGSATKVVRCEASRNLKWTIQNTGVLSPIYKLSLPSPDSPDLPLFQISKPNPNAPFWSLFYFAYAGHGIPPRRIEFGKIQKNQAGPSGGGGTRVSITGKTAEEKAVWQTLGEGNEDCVEWVVLCAALNLLDDEIIKAAEKAPASGGGRPPNPNPPPPSHIQSRPTPPPNHQTPPPMRGQGPPPPNPQQMRGGPPPQQMMRGGPPPQQMRGPPPPNGQQNGYRGPPPPQQQYRGPPPPQQQQQQYRGPPPPQQQQQQQGRF